MHENTAEPANCRRTSKTFTWPWVTNYADWPQSRVGLEQRGTTVLWDPTAPEQEGAERDLWPRCSDRAFSTLLGPPALGQRNPASSAGRFSCGTACKLGPGKSLDHVVSPRGCGNKSKSKYSQQQVLSSTPLYRAIIAVLTQKKIRIVTLYHSIWSK